MAGDNCRTPRVIEARLPKHALNRGARQRSDGLASAPRKRAGLRRSGHARLRACDWGRSTHWQDSQLEANSVGQTAPHVTNLEATQGVTRGHTRIKQILCEIVLVRKIAFTAQFGVRAANMR